MAEVAQAISIFKDNPTMYGKIDLNWPNEIGRSTPLA